MKIRLTETGTIKRHVYEVEYDGSLYIYLEYINENGKAVDATLQDAWGNSQWSEWLLSEVQKHVDELNKCETMELPLGV